MNDDGVEKEEGGRRGRTGRGRDVGGKEGGQVRGCGKREGA